MRQIPNIGINPLRGARKFDSVSRNLEKRLDNVYSSWSGGADCTEYG